MEGSGGLLGRVLETDLTVWLGQLREEGELREGLRLEWGLNWA